ncbi:hypothetical protein HYC85_009092 [Camellia sinensis]|uniref:Uncharacterized protein n=1 Tax=Camellia sinensis TaxID=4442 RepID=A0A7J7HGN7_CAMSI|nr:hypothetical protein HYC85_009092 [Camellia sinensis]
MWNNNIQPTLEMDAKWRKVSNNYKELTFINGKQEKRVQYLETRAMHLAMFYIAFQSIIFLSISKPSALKCSSWWKPFSLSVLTAFVFALNFATTIIKYIRTQYQYDLNLMDQQDNYEEMVLLESQQIDIGMDDTDGLDRPGYMAFDLPRSSSRRKEKQQKPDMFVVYQRYTYIWMTVSAMLAFTALVLHACRSSVCGGA